MSKGVNKRGGRTLARVPNHRMSWYVSMIIPTNNYSEYENVLYLTVVLVLA
jgi:hypothetical protein